MEKKLRASSFVMFRVKWRKRVYPNSAIVIFIIQKKQSNLSKIPMKIPNPTYPAWVNVYKKTNWKDPPFCSWENPLFRLGHVQKLFWHNQRVLWHKFHQRNPIMIPAQKIAPPGDYHSKLESPCLIGKPPCSYGFPMVFPWFSYGFHNQTVTIATIFAADHRSKMGSPASNASDMTCLSTKDFKYPTWLMVYLLISYNRLIINHCDYHND